MGLFDDLIPSDKPDLGAFADLVPKPRNFAAVANDTAIELANAAAGAVSAGANFISPGNRVSQYIDKNIVEAGEEAQSDVAKAAKRKFRGEVEAADGLTGELAAVGRHIVNAPLLTAAQAAGSFALPGLAVKGGGIIARAAGAAPATVANAGLAGGATAGAALAGGDAAGQAYQLARDAGATEEQAVAAGRQASVLPAIVGGAGGLVGAERLLAGASGLKGGVLARALKTGAIESTQEGFEEGLTQFEGQRAAMPYDPSIDPWKGVGAAAGMGAAMGGGVGAVTGAITKPREKEEKPITEGVDKIVGAQSVDEAITAAAQIVSGRPAEPTPAERIAAVMASVDLDAVRAQYGNEAATDLLTSLAQVRDPRVPRAVREQHLRLLETAAAAMREMPAAMPIGEATELLPTGDATELQTEAIPVGEAADMLPVGGVSEETPVLPTGDATELDAETIEAAAPPPVNWQVATRDTATLRDRLEAYRKKPDAATPPIQPPPPVAEQPGAGRAPDLGASVGPVPGVEATGTGGAVAAPVVADSGGAVPAGVGTAESGEALSQSQPNPAPEGAAQASGITAESGAELGTDLPTLKRQWQDAVRAGDGALAKRVNAQIVAGKNQKGAEFTAASKRMADARKIRDDVRQPDESRSAASVAHDAALAEMEAIVGTAQPTPATTASWVIREKSTGKVVMETFDKAKVAALNTAKYEAVPIQEYLASLNRKPADAQPQADEPLPAFKPYADMTADEKAAFDARTGDSPAKRAETAAKLDAIAKATEANRREAPNTTKPGKAESETSQRISVLNNLLECLG